VVATGGRRNHFKIGIKELIKAWRNKEEW
jgi:hypothetical protein